MLRARTPHVQYREPTEADRREWAANNTDWHDQDADPPVLEPLVSIGGRYRRQHLDLRRDLYGDPLEPEGHEWHFGW